MLSTINLEPFFDQIDQKSWVILPFETSFALEILSTAQQVHTEGFFKSAHTTSDQTGTIRNDQTFWLEPNITERLEPNNPVQKPVFQKIHSFLDTLMFQLKSHYRISLDHYECHFAHYAVGHFYKKHCDQTLHDNKRIFSFVIYLNENWTEQNGGQLVGYDSNQVEIFKTLPDMGQMIVFNSSVEHEVLTSHIPRWSLTGWFRIK